MLLLPAPAYLGTNFAACLPSGFAPFADLVRDNAEVIDPAIRNALVQKLAANFKYRVIDSILENS
jgi:hypothetical protein